MTYPFAHPDQGSGGYSPSDKDRFGELTAFEVLNYNPNDVGMNGQVKGTVVANVCVIQSPGNPNHNGEGFAQAKLFGVIVVDSLKAKVGQVVLARIGQKPGKNPNPAVELIDPTPQDIEIANRFFTSTRSHCIAQFGGIGAPDHDRQASLAAQQAQQAPQPPWQPPPQQNYPQAPQQPQQPAYVPQQPPPAQPYPQAPPQQPNPWGQPQGPGYPPAPPGGEPPF